MQRSPPLLTHRRGGLPGWQILRDHRALLENWHRDRYSGLEHRLNWHIRISHYDWRIVSRVAVVSPGQQVPALSGLRSVKYELSRRRHRATLLTITAAGTSSASRLGPLVPVGDGVLSNADTPGVDALEPLEVVPGDAVVIPSVVNVPRDNELKSDAASAIHSLSVSATLIAIGAPPADNCCDFTFIDSITKNPRNPPSPNTSGSARCVAAVARNSASCAAGFVNDACHISSKFNRSSSSPTHCRRGLLSITRCSGKS